MRYNVIVVDKDDNEYIKYVHRINEVNVYKSSKDGKFHVQIWYDNKMHNDDETTFPLQMKNLTQKDINKAMKETIYAAIVAWNYSIEDYKNRFLIVKKTKNGDTYSGMLILSPPSIYPLLGSKPKGFDKAAKWIKDRYLSDACKK